MVEKRGGEVERMEPVSIIHRISFLRFGMLELMSHDFNCSLKLAMALCDLFSSA